MSTDDDGKSFPKSMRQRRILDAAGEHPDASVDELASMVPSATTELVERLFEQYGDPAEEDTETTPENEMPSPTNDDEPEVSEDNGAVKSDGASSEAEAEGEPNDTGGPPDPDALSDKQREVLAHVAADPTATQQEIGNRIGVSSPTVSNRVNSIEGFEWSQRARFVDDVFDEPPAVESPAAGSATATSSSEPEAETETEPEAETEAETEPKPDSATADPENGVRTQPMTELETSIERLERRVAELEADGERATTNESVFDDPELVHKVVHACMESESISEAEELRILEGLLD